MPVQFARLRIAGFKSFAEPQTVEIRPGLTGIVGPNGCGKSNVVEALRWLMGENSARSLRGGEMDDVIFAGTANRASRNLAEVVLSLEATTGVAPPPFHEAPELEVSRRIERGQGSLYRINGKEARARDVQTLFADLASGARSSAMVSQGRVGALVNARPEERRAVLEEAAGITGLHARRHEAELRLRAAETNLARAEDLRAGLETQLGTLRKQAKQAHRYRTISDTIRDAEKALLSVQNAIVARAREAAQAARHAAEAAVAETQAQTTAATARATEAAAIIPALRAAEAEARTALERARIADEQAVAEAARAAAALSDATRRAAELVRDRDHARGISADAEAADRRLADESETLTAAESGYELRLAEAESRLAAATAAREQAETASTEAAAGAAAAETARAAAERARAEAAQRTDRLGGQRKTLEADRARAAAEMVPPERLEATAAAQTAAQEALREAQTAVERAEQARADAATGLAAARAAATEADSARRRVAAEAEALTEVLKGGAGDGPGTPMVDQVTVPPGLEAALGAAFDAALSATDDTEAARHWRALPSLDQAPALAEGAMPLGASVTAPAALARALAFIGLVEDTATAGRMQAALAPGQVLVSKDGAAFRWDGFVSRVGNDGAASVRLRQRNRLAGLRDALTRATETAVSANAARDAAMAAERAAIAAESDSRTARRTAEQMLDRARSAAGQARAQAAAATGRLGSVDAQLARLIPEHDAAIAERARAEAAAAAVPAIDGLRAAVEQARAALAAARAEETAARAAHDTAIRDHGTRTKRLAVITAERADWAERARDAAGRATDLAARAEEAEQLRASLAAAPAEHATRGQDAREALAAADAAHRRAATALTDATDADTTAARAARNAELALSQAREAAIRAEGAATQADHAWGVVAERILERLGPNAGLPDPPADLGDGVEAEARARRRHERLLRERDEMGPVNLIAEQEATEIETRVNAIVAESADLTTAINKLRGSIGHLNREGRERLSAVFAEIDRHFQALFTRMFGGGRAHLALVGSDDPLAAGLEIYAQPPGKKLATLSLLSGGEQALTALSLVFAVFRCNPAPVCVLDEVDAPLDDANVERFCSLLDDMVRETGTRFLVITHHQLTMARMDRLYGVTMQERGVSRLLSVDLGTAASMVEPVQRMAAE